MLGTIIHEVYGASQDDALDVANALDDICSPQDNYGFASTGVYAFHNPYLREILYVGFTNDFHRRFMEHNGMGDFDPKFSKWAEVKEYFKNHQKLGFSIFVQSSMEQTLVYGNKHDWLESPTADLWAAIRLQQGDKRAKKVEGALIEAVLKVTGKRPPWNKRDADAEGRDMARGDHYSFVRYLAGYPSVLTSKYTLRELSNNPAACGVEEVLHGARIHSIGEAVLERRNEITPEELLVFLQRHDQIRAKLYDELGYAARPYPLAEPLPKE